MAPLVKNCSTLAETWLVHESIGKILSIQLNSRRISFKLHYVQLFPSLSKIKLHNALKHNATIIQETTISIKFLDNVNKISEIPSCMVIKLIYFICIYPLMVRNSTAGKNYEFFISSLRSYMHNKQTLMSRDQIRAWATMWEIWLHLAYS